MAYPKILTIQDISCVGQCSLTVALPIISACGIETCVLPSAVLSTHTAGFKDYTFRDLTPDMPAIAKHWCKEGIKFDCVYTGFLGSTEQINYVFDIYQATKSENALLIVDPAMADNGNLYPVFDAEFVEVMKGLCTKADYIIPNITEACLLTDTDYRTEYDEAYIKELIAKLKALGCKNIIFTGVSYAPNKTGVVVYTGNNHTYYEHEKLPKNCHGTGDIYASTFVGALIRGKSPYEAAKIAADYTLDCIKATSEEENHWYGSKFEPVLGKLIAKINA